MRTICVFDVETGGLKAEENPITNIAMAAFDTKKWKQINKFETFVKPYNDLEITKKALDYTMVDMKDINNGIDVKEMVKIIIKFFKEVKSGRGDTGKPILAGHNVQFDIGFLDYAFDFCGKNLRDHVAVNNGEITRIDTMNLAHLAWDGLLSSSTNSSYSLSNCLKRVGVDLVEAHGAMNDVIATAKLLKFFRDKMRSESSEEVEVDTENTDGKLRFDKSFQF